MGRFGFLSPRPAWSRATPRLFFVCAIYSLSMILYGIDSNMFGSLQALPSWLNQFNNGMSMLPAQRSSIMNSVVWTGKIVGTMVSAPMIQRFGYRAMMYFSMFWEIVGVVLEAASTEWILFSIGRVFLYLGCGIIENVAVIYLAEMAPAGLRGFFTASVQASMNAGALLIAGVCRAYANEQGNKGWLVPVCVQFIPVVLLLMLLPFTPESPRWLIETGRKEEAIAAFRKIRPAEDSVNGLVEAEVDALEEAILEERSVAELGWLDLFRGTSLRRTIVCCALFFYQQSTGNQFIIAYGATFYKSQGLGAKAFTYTTVTTGLATFATTAGMFLNDQVGRRPILIIGTLCQTLFMFLVAGLGSQKNKTKSDVNGMVASMMLFVVSVKISINSNSYAIGAEIGGRSLRKKTMAAGTFVDVLASFAVTYSIPYLLTSRGANLGPKVGWIFGGISFSAFVFCLLFVPELKGRSLEEIDECFERRLPAWKFTSIETHGMGRSIREIEAGHILEGPIDSKVTEEDKVIE